MKFFNGSMTLKICEAHDLKPTDCSTRHQIAKGALLIDPYISVDVDDNEVARTTTKTKTLTPVWNENFVTEVHNGRTIGLTVFHDAAIPPDDFVANCSIPFEEIKEKTNDLWVCLKHIVFFCGFRDEECLELYANRSQNVGIENIRIFKMDARIAADESLLYILLECAIYINPVCCSELKIHLYFCFLINFRSTWNQMDKYTLYWNFRVQHLKVIHIISLAYIVHSARNLNFRSNFEYI